MDSIKAKNNCVYDYHEYPTLDSYDREIYTISGTTLISVADVTNAEIPHGVKIIGDDALKECTDLISVVIPDTVTSIGAYAFYGCDGLESIELPNSVTSIGAGAFCNCGTLASVYIPKCVASIGTYAFSDCSGLTSISVEIGNPKYHSDGNCLIETETKTLIAGCKNSVIPIDGSVAVIAQGAFEGCVFTTIRIPNGVTSLGWSAFRGCALTSIELPNSLVSIGNQAFGGCRSLKSVKIPDSITSIHVCAFDDCSCLTSIYFNGTKKQWKKIDTNKKSRKFEKIGYKAGKQSAKEHGGDAKRNIKVCDVVCTDGVAKWELAVHDYSSPKLLVYH